jgi:serine/threonine protein kinase
MGGFESPQVIGRYAIYGKIASGGMASVHFGRLLGGAGFSRTVAIKRLHAHLAEDPEFLSTMIDEARLAARVHHPNVVPTLDVVASENELLLVMEYVRGESLARLLRGEALRGQRVPLPIASAIAVATLHGLHAAHEATDDHGEPLRLVHRDVSPQNILVGVDGVTRVIDFGVAKAAGRLQTTRAGTIKGKIAYMAPEQLGAGEVTRAADIYAMGAVLWEMLAGQRVFQGDQDIALISRVRAGVEQPPSHFSPGLPPALDALVMKALSPNPAERFTTAREMADALLRLVSPAFSTDVGEWCVAVAHESLGKRGMMLAEIESQSGASPIVRARGTDAERISEAPLVPSQPSSLSVETRQPNVIQGTSIWRPVLAGLLGAAAIVTVCFAVFALVGKRPASLATPVLTSGALSSAAAQSPSPSVLPSATPPPFAAPAPAPPAPPPVATASPPEPTTASPVPSGPPAAAPRAAPVASPAPAAKAGPSHSAKPSNNCKPNFYFDDNGNKHFKPECFAQ